MYGLYPQPDPENDFTDEDLGILPLSLDQTQEAPLAGPGFLERFGVSAQGLDMPQPTGFLSGLVGGFGQGLANRGQQMAVERAKAQAQMDQRARLREQANQEATLKYRSERAKAVSERRKGDAAEAKAQEAERARIARENVPATQALLRERPWLARQGVKVGDLIPKNVAFDAPPEVRPETGVVLIDTPDGPRYVRPSQALGNAPPPKEAAPKPSTGEQKRALSYYNRGKQAVDIIERPGTNGSLEDRMATWVAQGASKLPDWLKPSDQKAYVNAQRAFTQAKLRLESGAAISPAEYESDARTYFAQPGDTPVDLERKKALRAQVLDGLAQESGGAYGEYYGSPYQPQGIVGAAENRATPGPPKRGGWFDHNAPKKGKR